MSSATKKLFDLYWQADRGDVRKRYDALFGDLDQNTDVEEESVDKENISDLPTIKFTFPNTSSVRSDIFTDTESCFRKYSGYPSLFKDLLTEAWDEIPPDSRPLALRYYISDFFDDGWSQTHNLEGLINFFGIEAATHVQHMHSPEAVFPISSALRYDQLAHILSGLGVELPSEPSEHTVWRVIDLSSALNDFATENQLEPWQLWATVYDFGPAYLLPDESTYPQGHSPRIWITAAGAENFARLDQHTEKSREVWSINREAKRGDIALMYCTRPRSALVAIYRCGSDAYEDPFWEPWGNSRWAELRDRLTIPALSLKEMKQDPVLKDWSLVKTQFQGMLQHRVPDTIWTRIKELIGEKDPEMGRTLQDYAASAQGIRTLPTSDSKLTELDFENQGIVPLLEVLGWKSDKTLHRQYEMRIKVGSGFPRRVFADFVGFADSSESRALLIVENKRQIRSDRHLSDAVEQCESYAGKLRCPRFVVAAPQGVWVYDLAFPGQSKLILALEQDILSSATTGLAESLSNLMGFEVLARK